jgi:hypothetical protein
MSEPLSVAGRLANLDEKVEERSKLDELLEERVRGIEDRLERIEPLAIRVPSVEARISRVESIMLEMQGEIRRAGRLAEEHRKRSEEKLDRIIELLHGRDQ